MASGVAGRAAVVRGEAHWRLGAEEPVEDGPDGHGVVRPARRRVSRDGLPVQRHRRFTAFAYRSSNRGSGSYRVLDRPGTPRRRRATRTSPRRSRRRSRATCGRRARRRPARCCRLTSPSAAARRDRHGRPEADVDVRLAPAPAGRAATAAAVDGAGPGGRAAVAQPQRAQPDRPDRHLAQEPARGSRRCARAGSRRPAPPAPAAARPRSRSIRAATCVPVLQPDQLPVDVAAQPALGPEPADPRDSAHRTRGSTRTSRCPSATGSRGR